MKVRAWIDGSWRDLLQAEADRAAPAVSAGIAQATSGLKDAYRSQVRGAGLGSRLANTWQGNLYQQGQVNAAGFVFSKAASIVSAYAAGVLIKPKSGGTWLIIPTDETPKRIRRKRATPELWEQAFRQKLQFVQFAANLAGLIAPAIAVKARAGKELSARAKARTRTRVIFLLIRQTQVKRRLSLAEPAREWGGALPQLILDNWETAQ